MNIHFWPNEKFTQGFIDFITDNFNPKDHVFYVIGSGSGLQIRQQENVFIVDNKILTILTLINKLKKNDKLFIHSLFNPRVVLLLFLYPNILKKCFWVVWGGDLYTFRIPKTTLKSKSYELLRSKVIRNIGSIITLVVGDYDLARKWYKVKAKHFFAQYHDERNYIYTLRLIEKNVHNKNIKNSSLLRVILGNSATKTNHHIEALDILSKFKNEDIEIICPLSYGDKNYAKQVIIYGNNIFGDKFVPLIQFIDIEEYISILSSVDVGVFNLDRQQALFNITTLINLGKKVFLQTNSTVFEHYNNNGIVTFDIETIQLSPISSFSYMSQHIRENNSNIIKKLDSKEYKIPKWRRMFDS